MLDRAALREFFSNANQVTVYGKRQRMAGIEIMMEDTDLARRNGLFSRAVVAMAGVALAGTVFVSAQSEQMRGQIGDIGKTISAAAASMTRIHVPDEGTPGQAMLKAGAAANEVLPTLDTKDPSQRSAYQTLKAVESGVSDRLTQDKLSSLSPKEGVTLLGRVAGVLDNVATKLQKENAGRLNQASASCRDAASACRRMAPSQVR